LQKIPEMLFNNFWQERGRLEIWDRYTQRSQ